MEQIKAVNALEPFLALTKSATSPRAAADLVTRATSAPNTYLFAELLQAPQIQALSSSDQFAPYLTLLEIFSYGTYASYVSTPGLPDLADTQALKLRQLSLLTLAGEGNRANLGYDALVRALALPGTRELEDLVISCVYAGLVRATLDPKNRAIRLNGVAPLRDSPPGAAPHLLASLRAWADRCDATLADLEAQIRATRDAAARRADATRQWDAKIARLVEVETKNSDSNASPGAGSGSTRSGGRDIDGAYNAARGRSSSTTGIASRSSRFGKRGSGHMDTGGTGSAGGAVDYDDEAMDLDDEGDVQDGKKRSSRRKL